MSPVDDINCNEACAGDASYTCGGKGHVSVYTTSSPIIGLAISSNAAAIIQTGTTVDFSMRSVLRIPCHCALKSMSKEKTLVFIFSNRKRSDGIDAFRIKSG